MMPVATPISTLPEITACCVSPPPCVQRISSSMPCFLKMPRRWPTSEIVVSQLPRWPAATLIWSSAYVDDGMTTHASATSTLHTLRNLLITASSRKTFDARSVPVMPFAGELPARGRPRAAKCGATAAMRQSRVALPCLRRRSLLALREFFCADTQRRPARRLRNDSLEGPQLDVRNALRRRTDGGAPSANLACRIDHDAAKLHDGDIACAEPLVRAIGDRSHGLPHRDVLVRNAVDPGMAAGLHRVAILQVVVGNRADAMEVRIEIDADLRATELAPFVLIDAVL